MEAKIMCPYCGKENDAAAPYCMWCGQALQGNATVPINLPPEAGRPDGGARAVTPSYSYPAPGALNPDQPTQYMPGPSPYTPPGGGFPPTRAQQMGAPVPLPPPAAQPPPNLIYPPRHVAGPATPGYYESSVVRGTAYVPVRQKRRKWPFVLLALLLFSCLGLFLAWRVVIRPAIESSILSTMQANISTQVNLVPQPPSGDPRLARIPFLVPLKESDANQYLSGNAASFSPAENPVVTFHSQQIILSFDLYGQHNTVTGNLHVNRDTHDFSVTIDTINGPAGYVLTREKLAGVLQDSLNQALQRAPDYELEGGEIRNGEIILSFRQKK